VDEVVPKLEEVIRRYALRAGHAPANWADLIHAGYLPGVPLDPVGHPYKLVAGRKVQVAAPDDLPFITKGLPSNVEASEQPNL
jgi:hypothetical protein